MDVLTSLLTAGQVGQLKEITESVSFNDVAEVASSSFRSLSSSREDSLIFILGLLNMATVFLYAVYAELFKPARMSWVSTIGSNSDDQHFFYKKIQSILDELVLHVHTSTYYQNAIQRAHLSSRFQSRSGEPGSFHGLLSFFEIPGLSHHRDKPDPPSISRRTREDYDVYLKREARKMMQDWIGVLVQSTFAETLTGRLFKRHVSHRPNTDEEHRGQHLSAASPKRRPRTFEEETKSSDSAPTNPTNQTQESEHPIKHLTKRDARNAHRNLTSVRGFRPQARRQSGAQRRMLPISTQPKSEQHQQNKSTDERKPHASGLLIRRRQHMRQSSTSTSTTSTSTTTTTTTTAAPKTSKSAEGSGRREPATEFRAGESFRQQFHGEIPVLPVQGLFPQGTVKDGSRNPGQTAGRQTLAGRENIAGLAKLLPGNVFARNSAPLYYDGELDLDSSGSAPAGVQSVENGFVDRLMHLIQQTTPLAMDVLHVYKIQSDVSTTDGHQPAEHKCLERLLCQLNQEWKRKGIVSAALAPFLSISMGWWSDKMGKASLPDLLMAVRAGWIGKHCPTLYPRCSNTGRPQWTVMSVSDDSLNQQSGTRPPIKVRPPFDFFPNSPTVRPLNGGTQTPGNAAMGSELPAKDPIRGFSQLPSATPIKKKDDFPVDWSGEHQSGHSKDHIKPHQRPIESRLDDLSPSSSVGSGSFQVDHVASRNGSAKGDQSTDGSKPWGKPSRFPISGDVELSDIVRGVYPADGNQTENEAENDEEEGEDEDEDEDDEDNAEEEENGDDSRSPSSTEKATNKFTEDVLQDLKKNHFSTKTLAQANNNTKAAELIKYEEMQKKKTHRLEMVPHRGLVHPWLTGAVWAPENRWPTKPDVKQVEDESESTDRHRDRVSFSHEDAVKEYRIQDYAMQYLRDRSA